MSEPEEPFRCREYREARCKIETCNDNENDPRSFCHNICAKPKHVCGRTTCEKFGVKEPQGKKIVCIPRKNCKIIRHYGPEEESRPGEEESTDDQHVNDYQENDDRSHDDQGKNEIVKDDKESNDKRSNYKGTNDKDSNDKESNDQENYDKGNYEHRGDVQPHRSEDNEKPGQKSEVKSLLENLRDKIDDEGMAALNNLAGSDICPCCECKICQCSLRNVESRILEDERKSSFTQKSLKDEKSEDVESKKLEEEKESKESIRIVDEDEEEVDIEETEKTVIEKKAKKRRKLEQMYTTDNLDELVKSGNITEEQKKLLLEMKDKDEAGAFTYSFDYYHKPDLEEFEARQRKQQKKEQEELERKKAEEARERLKRRKEMESVERESQIPEWREEKSQFYGKEQREDLIDEFSEIPSVADKIQRWSVKEADWIEYKVTEWGGIRHQDLPSVEETRTAEFMEMLRTRRISEAPRMSRALSQQSGPPPQIDLQKRAFNRSWLDDQEKFSLKLAASLERQSALEHPDAKIKKLADIYSPVPVLKPSTSDIKPEIPLVASTTKQTAETMEAMDSRRSHEKSIQSAAVDREESVTSNRDSEDLEITEHEIDVCRCLPGYCTCGKKHYIFQQEEDFEQIDKKVQSPEEEEEGSDEISEHDLIGISEQSSCMCLHSVTEMKITPIVSRVDVVAPTPMKVPESTSEGKIRRNLLRCVLPKYQKTLIIVKPEAVRYKDVILRAIQKEGLDVLDERLVQLTPEQVAEIYSENFGSSYFPMFVQQLSSLPVLVLAVAGNNAVQRWNHLVGPKKKIPVSWFYPASMRRRFCVNEDILDIMKVSDHFQQAKTEIRYFFPLHIIDPIIISSIMVQDYCDKFIHPTLLKGLMKVLNTRPIDPIGFLAEWLLVNNPYQPFYKQIELSLART